MKGFEDALLDIAWNNLESEGTRYKDIDNKAIGVITITGILMTFIIGSGDAVQPSPPPSPLLVVASISFLVTIILSIMAMSVRRTDAVSTKFLIEDLNDKAPERQIRGTIATIAEAETGMRKVGNSKASWMRYSVYALGVSVALLILDSLAPLL